jgi:membrane protein involved in D-alanine export
MIFTGNTSFIYVLLFIIVYNFSAIVIRRKLLSNLLLIIGSIVVLTTITNIYSIGILLLISSFVYYGGRFLKQKKQNKKHLFLFVSLLICLFVIKNYKIADLELLHRIGLSYILFRLIHFLVDSSKNKIQDFNLITFLNYIIFFPSFIAGPIDEYNNFAYWVGQKRRPYKWALIKIGSFKLFLGIVKKFFLVPIILNQALDFSFFEGTMLWQEGLFYSLILYSFYILFDFSGYSDIAIGTAYLIGIKMPENFNNPYFSSSLSVFWKKWHMTFSNFLFKYLFKPIVTNLSKYFKNSPRLLVSSIGYLLTFMICGIWHGNTLNFFYWGLWHGVGLILFKLWEVNVYKKYITSNLNFAIQKTYRIFAVLATFLFVTLGWFFFNYSTNEVDLILCNLTNRNSEFSSVHTVKNGTQLLFEIDFHSKKATSVDIEYTSSKDNLVEKYGNLPLDSNGRYYLLPKTNTKALSLIKIRANTKTSKGEWHSNITYLQALETKQSDLELFFFGKKEQLKSIANAPKHLLGKELSLTEEYKNQKIGIEPLSIEGYGWSLEVNYLAHSDYKVDIEYKFENEKWTNYGSKRDGKFNFIHIHGNESCKGTHRNLKPGKYQIRLRYNSGEKTSRWINHSITLSSYD